MTGPHHSEPDGATPSLADLRCVGPSTEATLREAAIEAEAILDREVSFVQLVRIGVDPGVAGRLRRAYSLPWSDAPTTGARLRRRAAHVRHLSDEERAWIAAGRSEDPPRAAGAATASDGSGQARDAEVAWRQRSGVPASRSGPDRDPAHDPPAPDDSSGRPLDPAAYTVPELEEALERVDDPAALAAVWTAEQAGDDRTTALDAIETRLRDLGVEPEAVLDTGGPFPVGRLSPSTLTDRLPTPTMSQTTPDTVAQLTDRVDAGLERVRGTALEARQARSHSREWLEALDREDWRLLSLSLLAGVVAFGVLAVVVTALQPVVGPPLGALPLLLSVTVLGVVAVPLRRWEAPGGYGLTLATGLLGVGAALLVAVGGFGRFASWAGVGTVFAYGVLGLALVLATYRSR